MRVWAGMGNLCLRPAASYEARDVAELADRVVAGRGREQAVADLEGTIANSCAGGPSHNLMSKQYQESW